MPREIAVIGHVPDRRKYKRNTFQPEAERYLVALLINASWSIRIRDISRGGIGLFAERAVEPETRLLPYLSHLTRMRNLQLQVRVVYCLERDEPDFPFILGCESTSIITEADINALI